MIELVVAHYLIVAAAIVISWRVHNATHRSLREQEAMRVEQPPPSIGMAPMPWREPDLPKGLSPLLVETLRRICLASGYPGVETFLNGAKLAYEAIIVAFAKGDMERHSYLVSDVVLQVFNEALALRKSKGESVELTFVGVRSADIVDAGMEGGAAWIDVRFVGEMVSVTRDRLGGLVAGEPGRVVDVTDIWTFERELRSAQPHWQLIHTDSDE